MTETFEYDVAISFAGEDRSHAESLAVILRDAGVRTFYDMFEQDRLWGKDLFQHLADIYGKQAKYCVVLVSAHYLQKHWTKHELRQAQARSFDLDREYVLPVRLDDSSLPGLAATTGYVDLRRTSVERIAFLLQRKLGMSPSEQGLEADRAGWNGELVDYNGVRVASIWPKQIEIAQHRPAYLVTALVYRIPYGEEASPGVRKKRPRTPCHDCAVLPGQLHVPSCDMEQCPACGGQAISCGCAHEPVSSAAAAAWEEGYDLPDES